MQIEQAEPLDIYDEMSGYAQFVRFYIDPDEAMKQIAEHVARTMFEGMRPTPIASWLISMMWIDPKPDDEWVKALVVKATKPDGWINADS